MAKSLFESILHGVAKEVSKLQPRPRPRRAPGQVGGAEVSPTGPKRGGGGYVGFGSSASPKRPERPRPKVPVGFGGPAPKPNVEHAQAEEVEACGVGCGPREVRGDVRIGEDDRERRHGATSPRWQGREASGDSLQGVGGEVRPGPVPARAAEGCDEGQGLWALMRCGAST